MTPTVTFLSFCSLESFAPVSSAPRLAFSEPARLPFPNWIDYSLSPRYRRQRLLASILNVDLKNNDLVVVRFAGQRIFQHDNSAARASESKVLELLLSSSRLVFPLYRTPPTTETFSYLLRVFRLPRWCVGGLSTLALHLCHLTTLPQSVSIAVQG